MNGTFKSIRENWPIILFLFGIAAMWGQTNARISALESKVNTASTLSDLQVLEIQIKTNNVRLERIENKVDRLLEQ